MISQELRVGKFTSSQIYKIMGSPKVEATYRRSKEIEQRLGRSTEMKTYSKSMAWGELVEKRVFDLLDLNYELCSSTTIVHPLYNNWSGSPDCINKVKNCVSDIKCYEPLNFANYADVLMAQDIQNFKYEFPKEYWQLVSNACILDLPNAEAILYLPYKEELNDIRILADNYDGVDQYRFRFITESEDDELAYQLKGGYYSNLITFTFEIPEEDKLALIEKIKK